MWSAHLLCFRLFLNYCFKAQRGFSKLCAKPTVCSCFKLSLSAHPHSMTLSTLSRFKTHKIRSDTNKWPHYTRARALAIDKPQPSDCKPIQQEKRDSSGKIVSNKRALDCQGLELYAWVCFMLNPFLRSGDSLMYCLEFTLSFQTCIRLRFLYKIHF